MGLPDFPPSPVTLCQAVYPCCVIIQTAPLEFLLQQRLPVSCPAGWVPQGCWAWRCRSCLPAAAGATPLCTRETWGANVRVCRCWQQFSAGKDKFLLEVSLGPACLKNDCLFKIRRIGANSALIPELLYLSEDYQKTKMKTKACGDWFSTSGKGQGRLQNNITFGFSQRKHRNSCCLWLVSVGFPRTCTLYLNFPTLLRTVKNMNACIRGEGHM